jgi:hypothetical protein
MRVQIQLLNIPSKVSHAALFPQVFVEPHVRMELPEILSTHPDHGE